MPDIIERIRSWAAKNLEYWERAALEKILTHREIPESDVEQLVSYFLQDAGLEPIPTDRPGLTKEHRVPRPAIRAPSTLERIFNLRNVNALPSQQEIRFGSQLTLVYGTNGAGKSGYARSLASAGFARGERDVLPNMDIPGAQGSPQADIEISCGGVKETITWTKGAPCPRIHGLYVFDGNSLSAHLNQSNAINFSPFGLSYLTQLAQITDNVRSKIRQLISEREQPHTLQPFFQGESEVSKKISALSAETDLGVLESLALLNDTDKAAVAELDKRVAQLKLQDIPKQIQKCRQEMGDLRNLNLFIDGASTALGESSATDVIRLVEEFQARREDLAASGANQFRSDKFAQIGTTEWRTFIAAAKALADAESKGREGYPTSADQCLLCRQPLTEEAASLIQNLWAFLKSDSQARLDRARAACEAKIRDLEQINVGYFSKDSNVRRLLQNEAPTLISAIEPQMQGFSVRKQELIDSLRKGEKSQIAPQIEVDLTDLKRLINIREQDIASLNKSDVGRELREAEAALTHLRHRLMLQTQMPKVREYVDHRKWAVKAGSSLGSTRSITTEYNELFKELVTDSYTGKFTSLLNRFRAGIKVTIEARGSKGETVRQIVLRKPASAYAFTVERVLSDGEKKAAALADFLTEVSLDNASGTIVFDDPVTSLDNEWKKVFADCLAEEARTRQVIVFTHDLSFLYHIKSEAEPLSVNVVSHWIRAEEGKPGFVYADNSPVCEREFTSASLARDYYSKAKGQPPEKQQSSLQQGFGALRTSYEALIIFELFNSVVLRFEERVSFGRLKDVCTDGPILEEIILHMEELSRHIIAHLHSDAMSSTMPTPADLLAEIEAFESIRKKIKGLSKNK